jgi:hypothetical protein
LKGSILSIDKTLSQIKQSLHHLEIDDIYWHGLQKYSANRAVQDLAARNLAEIKQRKEQLQAYLKDLKNLATNTTISPTHDNPIGFEIDGYTRETIRVYLQAHEGGIPIPARSLDPT